VGSAHECYLFGCRSGAWGDFSYFNINPETRL
jgi:hypothetical protein